MVEKTTPGMLFASATWHYATDRLPTDEAGDLFAVSRRYFRRESRAGTWTLVPIDEGAVLATGDEVEVQLSLRAKQAAEYVHLRDPRGAGLRAGHARLRVQVADGPGLLRRGARQRRELLLRMAARRRVHLPLSDPRRHRGPFRVGPAEVQSMYAPEFAARSAGAVLQVGGSGR